MTQPQGNARKPLSEKKRLLHERARVLKLVAIELGWLLYEWNRLQEALAELFRDVVSPDNSNVMFAIRHSTPNDRTQREMLRAALDATYRNIQPKPQIYNDVTWILSQLEPLSGRRNVAVHSPLVFIRDVGPTASQYELSPMHFFGNPRAKQLKGKVLIEEFKWYRDHISRLAEYAELLHFGLAFEGDYPWPGRPELPPLDRFRSRAPRRPKTRPK
jgi:hypothetical protein